MENPMEKSSDQGADLEDRPPPPPPKKICPLRAILDGMPDEWKDVDGMSPDWNDNTENDDAESIRREGPAGRKASALSAILSGIPRVMERRDPEQTRALFLEEIALQFDKKKGINRGNDAATQTALEAEIERGLRTRQYSEVLDSLASGASENTDDQKSYTQKLDDMVHQTGDEGLIRSWNAKKSRHANKSAVSTRSSATMLNAAFNVKEFEDDSRSYSTWLDSQSSEDNHSQDHETHEQSEGGEHREPRFREDSAANFLNSVTAQVLDEFGDSQKIEVDAHDESEDPNEPGIHEDSEDKLLGALVQQVMEEFTDYRSRESPSDKSDHSEGPKHRRFRERSALKFLKGLSDQIRPELKIREGGGEHHKSREKSAINFLNTVRDQIMERIQDTPQIPTSSAQSIELDPQYEVEYEIPNLSDHNADSETEYEVEVERDENVEPETNYDSPRWRDENAKLDKAHSVETSSNQNVDPETQREQEQ